MGQVTQFGEADVEVFGKVEYADGKPTEFFRVTDPISDADGRIVGGTHTPITEADYKAGAES